MDKETLEEFYGEFWEDLRRTADVTHAPQHECFFESYSDIASENGDCLDLSYTPVQREGGHGYQIDGIAVDLEQGEMHIAVCDFRGETNLETLNQAEIEQYFRRAERFIFNASKPEFLEKLEESSPEFGAAYTIQETFPDVKRIRFLLLSNARLVSRSKGVESKQEAGKTFTYNVLDFTRYCDIDQSRTGSEPIEIGIAEILGSPLPCLKANSDEIIASYLVAVPAEFLAQVYGLYGPRLLEQNVRTYLQARTKVNKGILETIKSEPRMFFAYNNGLTATASSVDTEKLPDGGIGISRIRDLQIVNGGQTTASILHAKDRIDADLEGIYIQMKLSVVIPEKMNEVVPKISRFANSQNKINEADFFSSHPFHVAIEKISRSAPAPQREGAYSASKWFYERARGQYRDGAAYGSTTERKKFAAEFPKDQVFDKIDLARYVLTFECSPHVVSLGAQKCFLAFAQKISSTWGKDERQFNEHYFRMVVGMAILYRWTDRMVSQSEWYKADRGYKVNIVTYSLAWLANRLHQDGKYIDFVKIWNAQEPSDELKSAVSEIAPVIARVIKETPSNVKNVSEYAKKQACWAAVSRQQIALPKLKRATIDAEEAQQADRDGRAAGKLDHELDFEIAMLKLLPVIQEVKANAESRSLLSPKSLAALSKLERSNINLTKGEKNALSFLLEQLADRGYDPFVSA